MRLGETNRNIDEFSGNRLQCATDGSRRLELDQGIPAGDDWENQKGVETGRNER